jgi:hypothetical protein
LHEGLHLRQISRPYPMQQNRVRTYLDPDAVGPLPRSAMADDSDALAAARTLLRLPDAPTQEISVDDVIEVVDPNRRIPSLMPVGYDTAILLPRTHLARYVVGALAVALVILIAAAVQGLSSPPPVAARAVAPLPVSVVPAVPPGPAALPSVPAPAPTIGTLRLDDTAEGQRVLLDGVVLSATAAIVRCGPHEVAVGPTGRTRSIDVPCGGEVTVFR